MQATGSDSLRAFMASQKGNNNTCHPDWSECKSDKLPVAARWPADRLEGSCLLTSFQTESVYVLDTTTKAQITHQSSYKVLPFVFADAVHS
jgi:hypothetical protein